MTQKSVPVRLFMGCKNNVLNVAKFKYSLRLINQTKLKQRLL